MTFQPEGAVVSDSAAGVGVKPQVRHRPPLGAARARVSGVWLVRSLASWAPGGDRKTSVRPRRAPCCAVPVPGAADAEL